MKKNWSKQKKEVVEQVKKSHWNDWWKQYQIVKQLRQNFILISCSQLWMSHIWSHKQEVNARENCKVKQHLPTNCSLTGILVSIHESAKGFVFHRPFFNSWVFSKPSEKLCTNWVGWGSSYWLWIFLILSVMFFFCLFSYLPFFILSATPINHTSTSISQIYSGFYKIQLW